MEKATQKFFLFFYFFLKPNPTFIDPHELSKYKASKATGGESSIHIQFHHQYFLQTEQENARQSGYPCCHTFDILIQVSQPRKLSPRAEYSLRDHRVVSLHHYIREPRVHCKL